MRKCVSVLLLLVAACSSGSLCLNSYKYYLVTLIYMLFVYVITTYYIQQHYLVLHLNYYYH
jgi:hypothetical protein